MKSRTHNFALKTAVYIMCAHMCSGLETLPRLAINTNDL